MKRTERHKLKGNPLAVWVGEVTETVAGRGRAIAYGVIAVVVVAAVALGYVYWRGRMAGEADSALAAALAVSEAPVVAPPAPGTPEATTPPTPQPGTYPTEAAKLEAALPKFLAVVDAHPGSAAATAALYHAAATLAGLGRLDEAAARYQQVIDRDRASIYAQMAELGLAGVHVMQGQLQQAITIYETLSSAADTRLPIDGVLVQMARAYASAGKAADATRVYQRIVDEFPQSVYAADATKALAEMKTGTGRQS